MSENFGKYFLLVDLGTQKMSFSFHYQGIYSTIFSVKEYIIFWVETLKITKSAIDDIISYV